MVGSTQGDLRAQYLTILGLSDNPALSEKDLEILVTLPQEVRELHVLKILQPDLFGPSGSIVVSDNGDGTSTVTASGSSSVVDNGDGTVTILS